jgi:DNA polymerase I-like protein with 3'-5' exonuclease and polymerase domains
MSLITLDFETYYTSKDLGFRTQTTEEYVRDKRFEVIGVSVQVDAGEPVWFSGDRETMRKWLLQFDWRNSMMLAHNTLFDGCILYWHFGITPKVYLDTLSMARALHGVEVGGSLAKLAERYQIGQKGDEVVAAIDKRRKDFAPDDLARYGEYCRNDVALTYKLFNIMSKDFPMDELRLIDMTIRMFTHPMLYVDEDKLNTRLEDMRKEKSELLSSLMSQLKCETEEDVRKNLSSNKKFAEILESFKIKVPMKMSEKQKKEVPALAKKDEGFIALCESEDVFIQHLCAVRLGTKSTLEAGRIQRFIDIGKRNKGLIPVPLKYYGAHTGRWSGMDKINFQNLPSRDPKKKALKKAIVPPEGYKVINADSSQIEARMVAWLAGQDDVVQQFARGEDVYSLFASAVYGRTITKKDAEQRFVGKTCILGLGYGTGALKLQHTLSTSQPISVKIDEDEAKRIVGVYRDKNDKIIELWGEADDMLEDMLNGSFKNGPKSFGKHKCVFYDKDGIILPNNLRIRYKNLRREFDEGKSRIIYDSRKGPISIWGGAVVENVVQALARIVVGLQMIEINNHHRVVLTVHDAAVCVVPEDEVDKAVESITGIMHVAPEWATGLPVACEANAGDTYGDC